jgi:hypothetical protein
MGALTMLAMADIEVYTLWWITIGVVAVVVIVAAGLLHNVLVVARDIGENADSILGVGSDILDNTGHLRALMHVYGAVVTTRVAAEHVSEVTEVIAHHAEACRHCPACVSPGPTGQRVGLAWDR